MAKASLKRIICISGQMIVFLYHVYRKLNLQKIENNESQIYVLQIRLSYKSRLYLQRSVQSMFQRACVRTRGQQRVGVGARESIQDYYIRMDARLYSHVFWVTPRGLWVAVYSSCRIYDFHRLYALYGRKVFTKTVKKLRQSSSSRSSRKKEPEDAGVTGS